MKERWVIADVSRGLLEDIWKTFLYLRPIVNKNVTRDLIGPKISGSRQI